MPIFKALSIKEENSKNEPIFLMYYFIHEFGVHYCKLLNETKSILFENTDTNETNFSNRLSEYLKNNFTQIDWIGETKFDKQTENILNRLKGNQ